MKPSEEKAYLRLVRVVDMIGPALEELQGKQILDIPQIERTVKAAREYAERAAELRTQAQHVRNLFSRLIGHRIEDLLPAELGCEIRRLCGLGGREREDT
jgi:hypothetical protein